ncbi:NAD(P)/FAD-dependent oxidoreductase [Tepidibacillus fermentans]|uniref:Ferredoxin--NADP reductase n=1 Tax=Tepidibacillus fermentans TaxID=1281767 RepID=A0A4R3KI69_9BACI|nr:NAD(P)/FAD-dependent oxidoreductase [Tepidibacillus fermentans]TCS83126.1 thioredoxin reductase (NADPH) [Tepidibacillus fermentans]
MVHDEKVYDITVIGGGPAGLFATFYAGMRGASVKLIEAMPQLGGQLTALYPEKYIYDVAGFPKVLASELVKRVEEQAMQFNPTVCLDEKVENVEKNGDGIFVLTTSKGTHLSKAVIITAGIGAFEPRRLDVEGAEKYEKTNLHYFVSDMEVFRDRRVLVFGGGDSAVDWALMLENIAKEVTIIHRRDKFRAHEHSVEKLYASKVNVIVPRVITKLEGNEKIERVTIATPKGEEEQVIEIDDLIVNFGFVSSLGPIANWGLEIKNGAIVVDSTMKTNIDGIYAAGDIATYEGKIKLIAAGFGEAPTAVNNAKHYINPEERIQPVHKH